MKQYQVLPSDFDEASVLQLFQEGRLYILEEQTPKASIDLLEYIKSIDSCCSTKFSNSIKTIWESINDSSLFDLVIKKGSNKGGLNKYKVMAIVTYLCNHCVYSGTSLQLYYILENTDKKGSFYKNINNQSYAISDDQRRFLNEIIKQNGEV